ncbi:fungal-specific transcription factor domain-containing protein [Aspergillus cavernicola]|uniref:Fungal-specific transcription factor domain-containing protein n=1 Tax=Aspergillus cavernicola TaxID=176166 RepID=A0ABR4IP13_9EURO
MPHQELHDWMPRFEYLGEPLGSFLLQNERKGMDAYHSLSRGSSSTASELDPLQVTALTQQGAFLLPDKELCDELVDDFFQWVAPILPVIDMTSFLNEYKNGRSSLLLFQTILLTASKISKSPRLLHAAGSKMSASGTFYKRAKALYDAGYESDRIAILQSLILMGWYCEDPRGVQTTFYWTRTAIAVAQSMGMHRSVTSANLSPPEKRLYKLIWWTLFTRDRLLSVCLGHPMGINLAHCDVETINERNVAETEDLARQPYLSQPLHAAFVVQYVKLSEIIGHIYSTYYSPGSKAGKEESETCLEYEKRLTNWLQQRPPEMVWQKAPHEFWASVLHLHYCAAICLLHRAYMQARKEKLPSEDSSPTSGVHLSQEAAYSAASCITDIVETLMSSSQLNSTTPFIVYCLYSALLVHIQRIHTHTGPTLFPITSRADVCLYALRELSKSWTVANLVYTMFCYLLTMNLEKNGGPGHGQPHVALPHIQPQVAVPSPNVDTSFTRFTATSGFDFQAMGLLNLEVGQFSA